MRYKPFVGGSYQSAAPFVDSELSMNVYPELIAGDSGAPSEEWVLHRVPGLSGLPLVPGVVIDPSTPIRGMITVQGRVFVVAGFTFYEIDRYTDPAYWRAYVMGHLLTVAPGTAPVIMKATAVEICLLADSLGYIFNLQSLTFTQITSAAFPTGASALAMMDTYFIASAWAGGSGGNQFKISAPLAGLSWSALDFGSSQEPDPIVSLAELHLYLWVFGQQRIVVFQNTGAASFPFQRVPGAEIEMGLAAANSVATVDNTLFWLGSNDQGAAVVYRADGFLPTRVSNHAFESAVQNYPQVSDAVASTYQEEGHTFYRIDFPSAKGGRGVTWVYDVSTRRWHNRGLWNAAVNDYDADPARFHAYCLGLHIVGDYRSGRLYQQSLQYPLCDASPIRWLRRAPYISDDDRRRVFFREMEVIIGQQGVVTPGAPQFFLRWSDDGGLTWSSAHSPSAFEGQTSADYGKRLIFRRLGAGRRRIFELWGADPIPRLTITGVDMKLETGIS